MYPKVYNSTQYARVNVVAIQDYQFQPSLQGSSAYQRLLDEIREGVHCLPRPFPRYNLIEVLESSIK